MKVPFVVFLCLGFVHGFQFLRTPLISQRCSLRPVPPTSIPPSKQTRLSYALDNDNSNSTRRSCGNPTKANVGESKYKQPFLFRRGNLNPSQEDVDDYFLNEPNPRPEDVVFLLQRAVKWKKKRKIDVLTGDKLLFVMSSLERILFQLNSTLLNNATVSTLYCMQVIPLADIERSGILRVSLHLLHSSRQRNINFTAIGIATMIYGMMKMSSDSPEVRDILSVLIDVIQSSQETFGAQAISTSLYGMRQMRSEHFEVRTLLNVLTYKLKNCKERMSGGGISMAIYGLQNMNSKYDEVRSLLAVLLDKTKDCHEKNMTAQAVGMSLYGLRLMDCDRDEVRSLLVWLTERAMECQEEFGPQSIAMALYGLQHMDSYYPEVKNLLLVLAKKMAESTKKFDPTNIIMSLHGLQRKKSKHIAVRKLLTVLAEKIRECQEPLTPQKYRKAMVWLQDMSMEHPESRQLLIALASLKNEDNQENNALTDVSNSKDFLYTYGFVQHH